MPYALLIMVQLIGAPHETIPGTATQRFPTQSQCIHAKDAVMAMAKAIPYLGGMKLLVSVACVKQVEA
jgi:hypothetical protein